MSTAWVWSPDGRRILTGSDDKSAKVWDAETGKELFPLKGHSREVTSVAWSPDGRHLLTGSKDHTARVWDADNGRELFSRGSEFGNPVVNVGLEPGQPALPYEPPIDCEDLGRGERPATLRTLAKKRQNRLGGLEPRWYAHPRRFRNSVGRDLRPGNPLAEGPHHGWFQRGWSPDGTRILIGRNDQTATVRDATSGEEIFSLKGHTREISSVVWSPDGGASSPAARMGRRRCGTRSAVKNPLRLGGTPAAPEPRQPTHPQRQLRGC